MSPSDSSTYSDLSRLFNPRGVAVVGASPGTTRIGAQALAALRRNGYRGAIYPINPKYDAIEEMPCYRGIEDVPGPCDVAVVCVGGDHVPATLRACGKAGIGFAIVLSAGFGEVGEKGAAAQAALEAAIRESGVRVVGPNCQGIMNLRDRALCGFGAIFLNSSLKAGEVALVSQSGGFGYGVLGHAQYAGIGFNYVVSTGNETDLGTLDFLEYFIEQDDVKVVATYLEGVRDGKRLRRLGDRALELGKPILVWKVGNTDKGRQAAASHTANVTSDYQLYRTAFASGAFIEIQEVEDLIDIARAFAARKLPAGNRAAILTVSGGAGVLFADCCERAGIALSDLEKSSDAALREFLPEYASLKNPFDLTAQVLNDASHFNRAVRIVAQDPNVDMVLMRAAQTLAKGEQLEILSEIAETSGKPILVAWGAPPDRGNKEILSLERLHIPWHATPGRATFAAAALAEFSRRLRERRKAPRVAATGRAVASMPPAGGGVLGEYEAKRLLAAEGLAVAPERLMTPGEIEALRELPFPAPLVLKISSPDIAHKTEVGGVALNIGSLDELRRQAREMLARVKQQAPAARVDGLLVQRQLTGREVIIGVRNDPHFGPLVMAGLGGIFVEIVRDLAYRFAPFDRDEALAMLKELRGYPLLSGYRGAAPADVQALADTLARVSQLACAWGGQVAEMDINPVIVANQGEGAFVADALIFMNPAGEAATEKREDSHDAH
jgi:acyl-CoA synthetase (NDP forming)